MPIPLLVLVILGLWVADLRQTYEAPHLLMALDFVFSAVAGVVVAVLFAYNFLDRGTLGWLPLMGGSLLWGIAGTIAMTGSLTAGHSTPFDANIVATIHNLCLWAASLCQMAGIALLPRLRAPVRARRLWLAGAAAMAAAVSIGIAALTVAGQTPVFFIPGVGGTAVRQFVLGSTIAMLILTVALLRGAPLPRGTAFLHWYALALLLQATGDFGAMVAPTLDGTRGWVGRGAQYLGGAYMLVAAIAAFASGRIGIEPLPRDDARHPYGVAVASALVAGVLRLVFLQSLGTQALFITFYPAVMLAALYGGLRAGAVATMVSAGLAAYYWTEPVGSLIVDHPSDRLALAIFLVNGVLVSWVAEKLQRADARLRHAEAVRREELEDLVVARTAALSREIAIRRRAEETMAAARDEAERANAAKSHFLAAASHDLRQPFQALRLFIDLLSQDLVEPRHRKVAGMANLALLGGENLLNALLDVSRLDAGVVTIERRRIVFAELAAELLAHTEGPARAKGLRLVALRSAATFDSDPVMLARLLRNLLDNAIKYTERGRILLGCRRVGKGVRIEVWDTGIGIAADHLPRIFDDFYQAGNLERDRNKGLGIGLGVVARTVRLLGHRITVRSWPGRGSVFAVHIDGA